MNSLPRFTGPVFCLLRLIVGLMLVCHGLQLVFGLFGGMPGSGKVLMQVGGWVQLVGGFFVAFGLFTRLSAFLCSGMMAVAYFMFHVASADTLMAKFIPIASAGPEYSNHGELAVLYCWVFLFIFFHGPGSWSIDALLFNKGTGSGSAGS
jgi:putative oxidoreductase